MMAQALPYGGMFFYETAEISELRASMGDAEVFRADQFQHHGDADQRRPADDFFGRGPNPSRPISPAIEGADAARTIERLGYEQIAGRFDTAGSWEPQEGPPRRLALRSDGRLRGGMLGLAFDIGGYTPEFVRALNELQGSMAEKRQ